MGNSPLRLAPGGKPSPEPSHAARIPAALVGVYGAPTAARTYVADVIVLSYTTTSSNGIGVSVALAIVKTTFVCERSLKSSFALPTTNGSPYESSTMRPPSSETTSPTSDTVATGTA